MRQILSILLLCFLIGPFMGHYSYLHLKKRQIKREVKWKMIAGIDRSELEHFTFALKDTATFLTWKHSREFSYKGEMYDIVERIYLGDSVHYVVWWDNHETQLNRKLQNLLADMVGCKSPINKGADVVSKVYKPLYEHPNNHLSFQNVVAQKPNEYAHYHGLKSQFSASPTFPPPELM